MGQQKYMKNNSQTFPKFNGRRKVTNLRNSANSKANKYKGNYHK